MMAKRAFPRDIGQNPTTEEIRAYMADLLDWIAKRKRADLMAAGFTEPELFDLRRVGNAYRAGNLTPEVFAKSVDLFAKLETLRV